MALIKPASEQRIVAVAQPADVHKIMEQTEKLTRAYWNVGVKKWGRTFKFHLRHKQMPTIDFSLRGRTAGQAQTLPYSDSDIIRYNVPLLVQNKDYFFRHTVPHEVAHLIAYYASGVMDHSTPWLNVMRSFGIEMAAKKYGVDKGRMVDPRKGR